jgi:uncharacterized membrane protein
MSWLAVARVVPLVVYPVIVYFSLEVIEAKYLAILLLVFFLLRHRSRVGALAKGIEYAGVMSLLAVIAFALVVWLSNSEAVLRLYPVLMNAIMFGLFSYTLFRPPSMIERFARLRHADLPEEGVRYTAKVTKVWCAFFLCNGMVAAYTALYASREVWAFYNGFLGYCLLGVLLAAEWLVRRSRIRKVSPS